VNVIKGAGIGVVFGLLFCAYSLAFYYGSILIENKEMKGGDVVNVLFAIIMGAFNLGNAAPKFAAFGKAQGAATKIFEAIDRQPLIPADSTDGKKLDTISGEIEFRNVNFTYPSRPDVPILKNFCLKVPAGKTVALVGESGSGKSTTVGLIERFYDCASGSVLIDGVDVKELNVKWLRQHVGIVSQEPVLFNRSIKQNVAFGILGTQRADEIKDIDNIPDCIQQEIVKACKEANAHEFISRLPSGNFS
jgi:ATP-binding cassette subfamily B (MDR/TAP) protein 1